MAKFIDAEKVLNNLPNDLPYKASIKRVLMQTYETCYKDGVDTFVEELKNCFCVSAEYSDIMNLIDNVAIVVKEQM
jgi:hypothetical protein